MTSASPIAFQSLHDANDILSAIQQTINALAAGAIDAATARTILYGLQIASASQKRIAKEATDTSETSNEEIRQRPVADNAEPVCDQETNDHVNPEHKEATTSIESHDVEIADAPSDDENKLCRTTVNLQTDRHAGAQPGAASHAPLPHSISPVERLRMQMRERAAAGRRLTLS